MNGDVIMNSLAKQPTATLINHTEKPLETVYWAFMQMHHPDNPNSLEKINISDDELNDFMDMLMKQPHQTVLEYIDTVWQFTGVSRAFQQQLTADSRYSRG